MECHWIKKIAKQLLDGRVLATRRRKSTNSDVVIARVVAEENIESSQQNRL